MFGCDCVKHWDELVATHPPTFDTDKNYYRWFHARHNDVSIRLTSDGRAHSTIDWNECCDLYGYPIEWRDAE